VQDQKGIEAVAPPDQLWHSGSNSDLHCQAADEISSEDVPWPAKHCQDKVNNVRQGHVKKHRDNATTIFG
jgi:hypothetical protein